MKKLEDALHELENLSKEEAANVNGGLVIIDVTCRETDKQESITNNTGFLCGIVVNMCK